MMTKTGMLIVTNPKKFLRYIPRLQKEVQKTLYVQILPENKLRFIDKPVQYRENCQFPGPLFSSSVTKLYSQSVSAKDLDVRILLSNLKSSNYDQISTKIPVEIVYFDQRLNDDEMDRFVLNCIQNKTSNCKAVSLEDSVSTNDPMALSSDTDSYENVVLGGTFDRLHCGHKALLSEAVLRCNKKLVIGVTTTEMLKSKKLWELIESCERRMQNVREFLNDVASCLECSIVPIDDMYGPTKDDPTFQMIVVSSETLKGSDKVNEVRRQNGLNSLVVKSVELLPDKKIEEIEEDKISSSNDRIRLLGTRLKIPEDKPWLPKWPYVVGFTGGIASGKSTIAKRLSELGAAIVNCDGVVHRLYKEDPALRDSLVSAFSQNILTDGHIDRKKLGAIVFNDPAKLNELNQLVWPVARRAVEEETKQLHTSGSRLVVWEAAVLLPAGWDHQCHEIWASIIPPEEAVRRLGERNGLAESEALARVAAQPGNSEYVDAAHVIFCSLWHEEFTRKQVDRAWNQLTTFLNTR